ncbi:hypothetical protein EZV62_002579 [Acer yangbiense]|uniref:MBD domain-containing protein n=1 Tax=Acer yangbiense TaxID=1000413 RepID=A0A5C7IXJ7_9ROSI|nr:hypothetical protein EZV62_002579 [Acer yangbiense]
MMKKKRSSPSKPIPLKIEAPELSSSSSRELQIVDPTSTIFDKLPFKLPRGWSVVERPRLNCPSHPGRVDKFRSLMAIQRYLSGDTEVAIVPRRMKSVNENYMQIVPRSTKSASSFGLPDDWIVEEKARNNINYCGTIDRYFIEPVTGFRFRSRIAAERYLKEGSSKSASTAKAKPINQLTNDISDENCSLSTFLKHLTDAKRIKTSPEASKPGHCSTEKHISDNDEVNALMLDYPRPPAKVKWVLGGPGGNIWNPLIDEALVSDSEKQEWSEKFLRIRDRGTQKGAHGAGNLVRAYG